MKLSLETRSPADARADVLVIGRTSDTARPIPELVALDKKLGGLLTDVLKSERFEGKAGQMSHFHTAGRITRRPRPRRRPRPEEGGRRRARAPGRRGRDPARP